MKINEPLRLAVSLGLIHCLLQLLTALIVCNHTNIAQFGLDLHIYMASWSQEAFLAEVEAEEDWLGGISRRLSGSETTSTPNGTSLEETPSRTRSPPLPIHPSNNPLPSVIELLDRYLKFPEAKLQAQDFEVTDLQPGPC